MKLTNKELQKYYFGALYFTETNDGYLQAFQYTQPQMDYFKEVSDFWYERCFASTAKTLDFVTEATELSFDYKIIWKGSEDSFELTIDGLVTKIVYVKDLKDSGTLSFTLPEGKKTAVVYLPADATVLVKNFQINAQATAPKKTANVLWLGDSITQGFGPLRSACTYVSVANRILNYKIVNQGIGGYVYDKKSLMKMGDYMPDKIIVALGTNQYGTEDMTDIEEYYVRLMEIYGNNMPVLAVSPIWRGDNMEALPVFESFCRKVKDICKRYKNVKLVDGEKLIPHLPEYFLDNLHPNCHGCEVYGRNLVREIERLGF